MMIRPFFNKLGKKIIFAKIVQKCSQKGFFIHKQFMYFFWPYWVKYHGLFVLWCQRMPKIFITVAVRPFFSKKMVKKMLFFDQFLQNYGLLGDWIGLKHLFSQMAYAKDDLVQFWAQTDHQKCLFTDLFFNKQGKKNHFCQNSPKMLPKRLFYSQRVHVFFLALLG